jgi:transcriptional regulator with XRE-family HTH domain
VTGAELIHARNQLRLTQSELAELLCVTSRTIQRYERARVVPLVVQWALLEIAYASREKEHGDDLRGIV